MPGPETGSGGEGTEETEKESIPSLKEQAEVYAEMFNLDEDEIIEKAKSLQSEMSEEERGQFMFLIFIPTGITTSQAWKMVEKEFPAEADINPNEIRSRSQGDFYKRGARETKKGVIAFARFSREADDDSLGENAQEDKEWWETKQKFMSPRMGVISIIAFNHLKNQQMHQRSMTMFPDYIEGDGSGSPVLCYDNGKIILNWNCFDDVENIGVRRVVSKEF